MHWVDKAQSVLLTIGQSECCILFTIQPNTFSSEHDQLPKELKPPLTAREKDINITAIRPIIQRRSNTLNRTAPSLLIPLTGSRHT